MAYSELFLDGNRGIYIPRDFADAIDIADWTGIKPEDLEVLRAGPDAESYWDAWQAVLDYAETKDGRVLHQDGDLWLVERDKAIEDLNVYFADVFEYETWHKDAGDNYAGLVEDVDAEDVKRQLEAVTGRWTGMDYTEEKTLDLDLRGLDLNRVIDLALEVFRMIPGSIFSYGPLSQDGLVLASFPIQEIETEVPDAFDGIVLDLIRESTDAFIPDGGRLAYIVTDAVWYAVASVEDLQDAINAEVSQDA